MAANRSPACLTICLLLPTLAESDRPLRPSARPLPAHRHPSAMAQSPIRTDVHQSLDVHRNLAPEVALDTHFLVDDVSEAVHFFIGQIANSRIWIDGGPHQKLLASVQTDTVDVCEANLD